MSDRPIPARATNATGRSTSQPANAKDRDRNRPPPGEPFIWITREMLESHAWRAASLNARTVFDRIAIEHMSHAGGQNGALPVTYDDFMRAGIRRGSIAEAIAEAVALGFVDVAQPGQKGWGPFKGRAARFRLTQLPTATGDPATPRWRRFKSQPEALAAVAIARARVAAERPNKPAKRKQKTEAKI